MKLAHKLIIGVIIAFFISSFLFMLFRFMGNMILHNYCKRTEVILDNEQKAISDMQRYIFDHKLGIEDVQHIDRWIQQRELIMVSIYNNDTLIYSSYFNNNDDKSIKNVVPLKNSYKLYFKDEKVDVLILYLFEHHYRDYVMYFGLLIFFLLFTAIMFFLIKTKVNYINELEKDIKVLETGALEYEISIKGNDELSALANSINEMRKAFIIREDYSKKLKESTNELMAYISHDLRTPLTTMIGYLEILIEEDNIKNTDAEKYIEKSKDRAYQLKKLIDNLFKYFFASIKTESQIQLITYFGTTELYPMIEESISVLKDAGFSVYNKTTNDNYYIQMNLDLIRRIFDNLLSNFLKYADVNEPIEIINYIENHQMIFEFRNKIAQKTSMCESTGLGIKTCEEIMKSHKGTFYYEERNDKYISRLIFPII